MSQLGSLPPCLSSFQGKMTFSFLFFFLFFSFSLISLASSSGGDHEDPHHPYIEIPLNHNSKPTSREDLEKSRNPGEVEPEKKRHESPAPLDKNKTPGGSSSRRLDFFSSAVQIGAQFIMYPSMSRMLAQQTAQAKNIVKGADTKDLKLQVYRYPKECLVVFDTIADQDNGDNAGLGLIDSKSIRVLFSYGEHEGSLIYTEKRVESIQFLKFPHRHLQKFEVPRGCIRTKDSRWRVYCLHAEAKKPCYVGRIEIFFSRFEGKEDDLVPIPFETPEKFIQRRMETTESRNYYDVLDWFETPTPDHRMIFDTMNCLMHFHFLSSLENAEKSRAFWLPNRQGIRVDIFDEKNEVVARKTAIPPGCGLTKVSDLEVAQRQSDDGSYKILIKFKKIEYDYSIVSSSLSSSSAEKRSPSASPEEDEEGKKEKKKKKRHAKKAKKEEEKEGQDKKEDEEKKEEREGEKPSEAKGYFSDTVVIPKDVNEENGGEIRPERDFEYYNEDQLEFPDYFPERSMISLDDMERVKVE
ncbi:hypothetical protein CSUI_008997 [Cystoisospora suis]|uniref:Transmembrane protein n=1 Tax=Cystoisospora suis TaxID=483139 RepID=A0A2C6JK02_9APIC|nr:hypothetical protein CSUI_008997 [Cystoisospora suis]